MLQILIEDTDGIICSHVWDDATCDGWELFMHTASVIDSQCKLWTLTCADAQAKVVHGNAASGGVCQDTLFTVVYTGKANAIRSRK